MKALMLWMLTAHPYPDTLLTVDRISPPVETRTCPASTFQTSREALLQHGTWKFPPDILICDRGPVTVNRVERAVQYWDRLGYKFGNIIQAPRGHYGCASGQIPYNTIMIDIPGQGFQMGHHLGETRTWRNSITNQIFKAKIEIIPAWGRSERILEHEIGHALGWNDIQVTGHMMNGAWLRGGYNSEGLEK